MILVTVGNATQPFRRLLEAVERLAGEGAFAGEEVLMQSGHDGGFEPRHARRVPFLGPREFAEAVAAASVVICHAGAGTLWHVFGAGKVPVVMPRRRRYGEHLDDQLELVRALVAEGRVEAALEPDELPGAIAAARRRSAEALPSPPTRMLTLVERALVELAPPAGGRRR